LEEVEEEGGISIHEDGYADMPELEDNVAEEAGTLKADSE